MYNYNSFCHVYSTCIVSHVHYFGLFPWGMCYAFYMILKDYCNCFILKYVLYMYVFYLHKSIHIQTNIGC